MQRETLKMPIEQREQISTMLKNQGLSQAEIDEILNGEYSSFETPTEIQSIFGNGKYENVLNMISDGYTMEEIEQSDIPSREIQEFKEMLDNNNWTIENAKAIHQYTDGSNMILGIKRGQDKATFKQGIEQQLSESLKQRGISQDEIMNIQKQLQEMDYGRPVHENYELINNYMREQSLPSTCAPSVRKAIQSMDRFEHIDETIEALDDGLSKTKLQDSMKLYRAMKGESLKKITRVEDLGELKGRSFQDTGQTSTSPLYESSFAKYDTHNAVFEIYAPKGTRGSYVTQLSDYGTAEQEVLLNPNDLYITDVQDIVDKNGQNKTILKALMLSKERKCYKGIDKEQEIGQMQQGQEQDEHTFQEQFTEQNLPIKQNRFSKFFNQVRARFSRQNRTQTRYGDLIDEKAESHEKTMQPKTVKTKEKKSWELEPEEKARIQRESAKIAQQHREQKEQQRAVQNQELQQDQPSKQQDVAQQGDMQPINQEQIPIQPQQPIMDMGGMEL